MVISEAMPPKTGRRNRPAPPSAPARPGRAKDISARGRRDAREAGVVLTSLVEALPISGTSAVLALKSEVMGAHGRWSDAGGGTAIVLLTRDLRLCDQPALAAACRGGHQVIPLFVYDPALLGGSTASPYRLRFLVDSLGDLRRSLTQRGGQLFVRRGDPTAETMKVAAETGAASIFVSDDVSRYARRRHHQLSILCAHQRVRLVTFPGAMVVPPGGLVPAGGDHYRVFTPYWKRWRSFAWRPPVASPRRVRVPPSLAPGSLSPPGAGRSDVRPVTARR